jgi:hypothetical protein
MTRPTASSQQPAASSAHLTPHHRTTAPSLVSSVSHSSDIPRHSSSSYSSRDHQSHSRHTCTYHGQLPHHLLIRLSPLDPFPVHSPLRLERVTPSPAHCGESVRTMASHSPPWFLSITDSLPPVHILRNQPEQPPRRPRTLLCQAEPDREGQFRRGLQRVSELGPSTSPSAHALTRSGMTGAHHCP